MRGCVFNKGLFRIFHAILSVVGTTADLTRGSDFVYLSRLRWRKMSFHQALDLTLELDEAAVGYGVRMKRYHVIPYEELDGIPVALVARFGVISKSTDRILVSYGG
ncbi:hypothetical protein Tco_1208834 [Tanacetum coccineum]